MLTRASPCAACRPQLGLVLSFAPLAPPRVSSDLLVSALVTAEELITQCLSVITFERDQRRAVAICSPVGKARDMNPLPHTWPRQSSPLFGTADLIDIRARVRKGAGGTQGDVSVARRRFLDTNLLKMQ